MYLRLSKYLIACTSLEQIVKYSCANYFTSRDDIKIKEIYKESYSNKWTLMHN